jgi:methyl-accepting chemotaxis protein
MEIFLKIKKFTARRAKLLAPLREWSDLFRSLVDKLTPLAGDSEKIFLSIGSCLQDFTVRARELSEMSASAARLTSGGEIGADINRLREQLDTMIRYLDSSEKESGCSMKKLQYILEIIEGFDVVCNGFTQIADTLQFLSVSTRVESARLGRNAIGFNLLSDDVKKLAALINTKSVNILNHSKSLSILVRNAISRTQELLNLQRGSAVNMLRDAQSSLESLTGLNEKSSETSHQIAMRSSGICKNIGEVVTSMQFHDITRQEMEHVAKALEHLRGKLEEVNQSMSLVATQCLASPPSPMPCVSPSPNGSGIVDGKQEDFIARVGDVCTTQSSQLLHTKEELVGAVDCVIKNLLGISENVKDIVGETQALSGSTNQSGAPLLSQIEKGIVSVIKSLRENAERGKEISTSVTIAVHGMSEFVEEIEDISVEIKLIAFNAQVKAKRTGADGNTLGVLAEGIQGLAVDAGRHTTSVLEKLKTITDEAKIFHGGSDASSNPDGVETTGMVNTLEGLAGDLHRTNADFTALLVKIAEGGQTLGEDIEALAHQIVFHKEMGETLDGIATELIGVAAHGEKLVPSSGRERRGQEETADVRLVEVGNGNGSLPGDSTFSHLDVSKQAEVEGNNVELF